MVLHGQSVVMLFFFLLWKYIAVKQQNCCQTVLQSSVHEECKKESSTQARPVYCCECKWHLVSVVHACGTIVLGAL